MFRATIITALWVLITLTWEHDGVNTTGYNVYARATTQPVFARLTSVYRPTATVWVDGRRNWWFYVTAQYAVQESPSSNHFYIPRGY